MSSEMSIPFYMESTFFVFLSDHVFRPCDDGLDFGIFSSYVGIDISSHVTTDSSFDSPPRIDVFVNRMSFILNQN